MAYVVFTMYQKLDVLFGAIDSEIVGILIDFSYLCRK
jgi:hypothetical protein